ncbi:MAG: hypothetical protein OEV74_10740 [Cyclobacteriaceae bacterium]|nr:hypothetical protein [Cyclobacteriaceae bacterium]MDH4296747.1 hypothetical protein [Cyclobacteriaceae bacterium]MDH5248275.1 hypothetical protein [Cyclobacteriaceae bacterium]
MELELGGIAMNAALNATPTSLHKIMYTVGVKRILSVPNGS